MDYKTIITPVDSADDLAATVGSARTLAERLGAHLTVAAFAYEPDLTPFIGGPLPSQTLADAFERARAERDTLVEAARAALADVATSEVFGLVCPPAALAERFGELARFSDLAVLAAPQQDLYDGQAAEMVEGALFAGDAPVLILPPGAAPPAARTILLGWNDSREALRAARVALPFLRAADRVEIALFDPTEAMRESGAALARLLTRHGVPLEINVALLEGASPAEALKRRALEIGADLLALGAYSQSRFREFVLGGATRDLMRDVSTPMLMAR